jgi:hypothetical protein
MSAMSASWSGWASISCAFGDVRLALLIGRQALHQAASLGLFRATLRRRWMSG